MKKRVTVEEGSGNVFENLGHPNAPETLFKARLARRIAAVLLGEKLTQTKAAQLLGVDQPKISRLLRGQLREFWTDGLIHFLLALDQDVEVVIRNERTARRRGTRLVLTE